MIGQTLHKAAGRIPPVGLLTAAALATAPFWSFLYRNHDESSFTDLWHYAVLYAVLVIVVIVVVSLFTGRQVGYRWSLLLGWAAFAFFWYRDVENFANDFILTRGLPARGPVVWLITTSAILLVIHYHSRRPWFPIAALCFALTIAAVPLGFYVTRPGPVVESSPDLSQLVDNDGEDSVATLAYRPDIYFIMPDGFGRQDVLDQMFDIDIGPFVEGLRQSGFVVADRAYGSHPLTLLELPAILNQEYQVRPGDSGPPKTYETQMATIAGANRTQQTLYSNGYQFISADSGNLFCNPSPISQVETCIGTRSASALHRLEIREQLLMMTPVLGLIHHNLLPDSVASWLLGANGWWNQSNVGGKVFLVPDILNAIDSAHTADIDKPLFVAAHMMHTHPPFTLDGNCNCRDEGLSVDTGDWDDTVGLELSVECFIKQIEVLIERIDPSAVVVIQSDHGPVEGAPDSLDAGAGDPDAETFPIRKVWGRASVFSAVRVPPPCRPYVSDSYAGVNTFRFIFDCLNGELKQVEPHRAYWTWYWDDQVYDITSHLAAYELSIR